MQPPAGVGTSQGEHTTHSPKRVYLTPLAVPVAHDHNGGILSTFNSKAISKETAFHGLSLQNDINGTKKKEERLLFFFC